MNLERLSLQTLEDSWPRAVVERTLLSEVNLLAPAAVTRTELLKALGVLERKGQVVSVLTEDVDPYEQRIRKWKITNNGRARLSE